MTPESYMKRYHCGSQQRSDACPLSAADTVLSSGCSAVTENNSAESGQTVSCCCKPSMAEALRLLCQNTLSTLTDFSSFYFLTDTLSVGSALAVPGDTTDNLAATPAASLRRFAPCNCDLLEVSGTAYYAIPGSTDVALTAVDQLSLCAVKAVAFQILNTDCPTENENCGYDCAVRTLRRAIQAEGGTTVSCAVCQAHCDCDDCCCAAGLIAELATRNLSRQATVTVGPLFMQNVTVLGALGSVLVLTDETLNRVYFVCANAIEAIG